MHITQFIFIRKLSILFKVEAQVKFSPPASWSHEPHLPEDKNLGREPEIEENSLFRTGTSSLLILPLNEFHSTYVSHPTTSAQEPIKLTGNRRS